MLNLYFWKTDEEYRVYNHLTHQYYGTIRSIEELDRFIDRDLDGYITHQSYNGETLYGWIPRKSYHAFRSWYEAPENLDMRIVPADNFRQTNALRVEVISPQPRCIAQPKDDHARRLMEREDGWYHAQHCWSSFGYCIRTKCSLCPVYHEVMDGVQREHASGQNSQDKARHIQRSEGVRGKQHGTSTDNYGQRTVRKC